MTDREAKFEAMLQAIQQEYHTTLEKMEKLKAEDKTKTATYRQLLGDKLMLQNILTRYKTYGLLDEKGERR
ncbi:MAG: hypothetical protein PUK18_03375 [Firmicutes bacterium]|nr:hypothetical protein [Bacillota bacterium]MDY6160867.1 hypothetical protein [Candidatus Faecousia sp.]